MLQNLSNQKIPQDVEAAVNSKFEEIEQLLKPYLVTLDPDYKKQLLKMGDRSEPFVEKSHEHLVNHPDLFPPIANRSDFDTDVYNIKVLKRLCRSANKIADSLSDTFMVSGSEAMEVALMFYNNSKVAADKGIFGAQNVYNELSTRWQKPKRKKIA